MLNRLKACASIVNAENSLNISEFLMIKSIAAKAILTSNSDLNLLVVINFNSMNCASKILGAPVFYILFRVVF